MPRAASEQAHLADRSIMSRDIGHVLAFEPYREQQHRGQHGGQPATGHRRRIKYRSQFSTFYKQIKIRRGFPLTILEQRPISETFGLRQSGQKKAPPCPLTNP